MVVKYLLDSSVFIEPYQKYYSFELAPGFWNQFEKVLQMKEVGVVNVVYSEITKDKADPLAIWIKTVKGLNKVSIKKDTNVYKNYGDVLSYVKDCGFYKESAVLNWAKGSVAAPWLIAAAKAWDSIIITEEAEKGQLSQNQPSKGAKIPDVAAYFGVRCENLFYFMREMGIRWK